MRIRWKLLILLLAMSLAPFGVVFWFGRQAAVSLRDDLAARTQEALTQDAERFLLQTVRDHGRLLQLVAEALEHNVRIQAREVERCLAAPVPAPSQVYFAGDFETEGRVPDLDPSPRYERLDSGSVAARMPVSYTHPCIYLAPGVQPQQVLDDVARLSPLWPVYDLIYHSQNGRIYWQYTSLVTGVHQVYPGHGFYPGGFDPRQRPWYVAAMAAPDVTWGPPAVDAATRRVVLTVAKRVHKPDGAIAGVTALDVRIRDMVAQVELPGQWARDADTMIVYPLADREHPGQRQIEIIAREDYVTQPDWDVPVPASTGALVSDDEKQLAQMFEDLLAERAATRIMPFEGRSSLWAYGPLPGTGATLLAVVPYERILEPVHAAQEVVNARIRYHRTAVLSVLAVVLAVLLIVALLASRHVTRPVQELAEAAQRIADGDLDTPTRIRSRDELGELGATVNAMLPKLRDGIRLKQSLALAMEVQQNLLPQRSPRLTGFDIAGKSIYCDETGGDYYDFVDLSQLSTRTVGIAVGDVTGHGIAAALLMATARALLRSRAEEPGDLGLLLSHINRHLAADVPLGRFMTLLYLIIESRDMTVRWASAGHDPAILYDPSSDSFDELAGGGIPLGIESDWQYEESGPQKLKLGQIMVVGTDGIWEACDARGDMFGKERLRDVVRASAPRSASQISLAITDAVAAFRGDRAQDDDITLVVVKVTPNKVGAVSS